tara:strand:+ start:397 stop:1320 length:924 start_codon:yes stop_codon:yes gene_type:complete
MFSIILLSYNSNKNILKVYQHLKTKFEQEKIDFECIIMDDNSDDNSYEIAVQLEKNEKNVRAFQLSKNFTSHYSIFAGLSVANGNCAMAIPDDFQIPTKTIIQCHKMWEKGAKIVIPYRKSRNEKISISLLSNLYYWIMNKFSEIDFPPGGADTFLIDREIIDLINTRIKPKNTSSIIEVLRLGFNPEFVAMERPASINIKSRWTFEKKIKLALDTLIASSSFPIKLISKVGLLSFLISILLSIFYIYAKLNGMVSIPGWTLMIIFISLFSGLILLSIGVIAEYIWRIFEEVKNRPGFIIKDKVNED